MPFICIYVHFVWTTKHRIPFLASPSVRRELWRHIRLNGHAKGIHVDHVGGWIDHCHCLVSLKGNQTLESVVHLLKGESSHYVNENLFSGEGFCWQDGYYAAAVQFERVQQVRRYIQGQEAHHSEQSFADEYEKMLLQMGFQGFGDLDFG